MSISVLISTVSDKSFEVWIERCEEMMGGKYLTEISGLYFVRERPGMCKIVSSVATYTAQHVHLTFTAKNEYAHTVQINWSAMTVVLTLCEHFSSSVCWQIPIEFFQQRYGAHHTDEESSSSRSKETKKKRWMWARTCWEDFDYMICVFCLHLLCPHCPVYTLAYFSLHHLVCCGSQRVLLGYVLTTTHWGSWALNFGKFRTCQKFIWPSYRSGSLLDVATCSHCTAQTLHQPWYWCVTVKSGGKSGLNCACRPHTSLILLVSVFHVYSRMSTCSMIGMM